jgi:hypothetical protein
VAAAIRIYQLKRIARCIMHARVCTIHSSRRRTYRSSQLEKFLGNRQSKIRVFRGTDQSSGCSFRHIWQFDAPANLSILASSFSRLIGYLRSKIQRSLKEFAWLLIFSKKKFAPRRILRHPGMTRAYYSPCKQKTLHWNVQFRHNGG